ncbi:MAG: tRNA lysidine(34) synthetase TilS [Bacteroidales bacterium]|nr:tRNA lysidine(34) synthetase TilS [Bacteroidales bacterium]
MKVLLAVSGGVDSMYMLHRAPELFPGASFAAAHCNFALRGEESDGDEAFVREVCSGLGVECYVKRFDTLGYAGEHGVSVEMAARDLRYAWFGELIAEHGFDALATAHNANDNAETLILNLLRGSGTKGLRGIPGEPAAGFLPETSASLHPSHCASLAGPSRSRSHGRLRFPGGTPQPAPLIIRPLLGVGREEIKKWMQQRGLGWREDSTNALNDARRNIIRNEVFPIFGRINPSFIRTLGEDMERIRQTDDIADEYFREAAQKIVEEKGSALEISVLPLLELKHWRYVLWRILEDCSFSAPTFGKLCELLERYRTEPLGTVTLSGKAFQSPSYVLRARKKTLVLLPR